MDKTIQSSELPSDMEHEVIGILDAGAQYGKVCGLADFLVMCFMC